MSKKLIVWQATGFVLTSAAGYLLHFMYEWSNKNTLIAVFSAVNESVWEHMKLIFFPLFVFALIQRQFYKKDNNFWNVKLIGISVALILVPVLFYFYNGAVGKSSAFVNIAIFFIADASAFILEAKLFNCNDFSEKTPAWPFAVLCGIFLLFAVFTFAAPELPLFQDPLTKTYGI